MCITGIEPARSLERRIGGVFRSQESACDDSIVAASGGVQGRDERRMRYRHTKRAICGSESMRRGRSR